MSRAMWQGNLSFGLVSIPVGAFVAESPEDLQLSLLDKENLGPIGYRKVNKTTGSEVPPDRIVKGYEYERGNFVVLDDEDFKKANVKANQILEIEGFVKTDDIDPRFFEKPYYLVPQRNARKSYVLLAKAMESTHTAALTRIVFRSRQHFAAVVARGGILMLELLRFASELRSFEAATGTSPTDEGEIAISPREEQMAVQLIQQMTEEWHPEKFKDNYHDDIMALIEEKARTGQVHARNVPEEVQPTGTVFDLLPLLKRSLEEAETKRQHPETSASQPSQPEAHEEPPAGPEEKETRKGHGRTPRKAG